MGIWIELFAMGVAVFAAEVPADVRSLLAQNHDKALAERIDDSSAMFLGRPYLLDPFGEGETGRYDRDPLYRFDVFDCTTFVETVMALSLSEDLSSFANTIDRIRYLNGEISYVTRNHFPEIDWIPNNTRAGFVRDVTEDLGKGFGVQIAEALIDKPGWYAHMKISQINVPGASPEEKARLLDELHHEGGRYRPELSRMPFIPLAAIFHGGEPDMSFFNRIPSGTLLNIVRPNWDMVDSQGTHLNVSHQAIAIRKNGVLYIRHATTGSANKVLQMPLTGYLRGLLGSATIKGINLLEVRAR